MRRGFKAALLGLLALLLTACAAVAETLPRREPAPGDALTGISDSAAGLAAPTRRDSQGAVEFAVTPLNLDAPGETLDFAVVMDTHSVDLAWDLAARSVLAADTGLQVQGQSWPAGGGHHYQGTLTFPAETIDGRPLLAGAKSLTLTIRDTGAAERIFVWDLAP